MSRRNAEDRELREQLEQTAARLFSTEHIEARIAKALVEQGEFRESISADDLAVILRNVVYFMFAHQRVAGHDVSILHNVPIMNVEIADGEAQVEFVVHIHKPIVVFIEFNYAMVNNPEAPNAGLAIKAGSLRIAEKTRRFDLKAKAALAALNVARIAYHEMSDLSGIIRKTLPHQLQQQNVRGELTDIHLHLNEESLHVTLRGLFSPIPGDEAAA
jgi:hypothetical protein